MVITLRRHWKEARDEKVNFEPALSRQFRINLGHCELEICMMYVIHHFVVRRGPRKYRDLTDDYRDRPG